MHIHKKIQHSKSFEVHTKHNNGHLSIDHYKGIGDRFDLYSRYDYHRHNENGPATVMYDSKNNLLYEAYYLNNLRHRLDQPAEIQIELNRKIKISRYFVNGLRHREDGPAVIVQDLHGNLKITLYYLNDKLIDHYKFKIDHDIKGKMSDEDHLLLLLLYG